MKARLVFFAVVTLTLSGCGLFQRKPALPAPSAVHNEVRNDEFAAAVRDADVIYYPLDAAKSSLDLTGWRLAETLRAEDGTRAVAWQTIDADQQAILDEIASRPDRRNAALSSLRWRLPASRRASALAVLRAASVLPQMAIGLPADVQRKLANGERLDAAEREALPNDYREVSGGLESFAERLAATHGLRGRDVENLYRAHLAAEQFAAEKIVNYLRANPGARLLVFTRRRDLSADGVPFFVAQKWSGRQLDFDQREHEEPARLLTQL